MPGGIQVRGLREPRRPSFTCQSSLLIYKSRSTCCVPGAVHPWVKPLQYELCGQEPQRGRVTAFARAL